MNETLQNALAEIITSALQNAGAAKDFILSEMPEVVQQLLWWHGIKHGLYFLLGLVLAYFCFRCVKDYPQRRRRCIRSAVKDREAGASWTQFNGSSTTTSIEYDYVIALGGQSFLLLVGAVASGVAALFLLNLTWLQVLIAPKVYLIEYAAELVK